jgi:hypothetical protein
LAAVIAIVTFAGVFLHMVTTTCPPTSSGSKAAPSYHQGSGRRPEKVHCTELLNTLYDSQRHNYALFLLPSGLGLNIKLMLM